MKIIKGRVINVAENEKELKEKLKRYLKVYFKVNFSSLSLIIQKVGINIPANVVKITESYHTIELIFEGEKSLKFFIGDMSSPYPVVIANNKIYVVVQEQ